MHPRPIAGLLALALTCAAASASAEGMVRKKTVRERGSEVSVVPFVGGDTDYGLGVGLIGAYERYAPRHDPYEWRFEVSGAATFKKGEGDSLLVSPFQDINLRLTYVATPALRVLLRASYTTESLLTYSGVGNVSPEPIAENSPTGARQYFTWGWTHPTAAIGARVRLSKAFYVQVSNWYSQNWISLPRRSKVRDDALGLNDVPLGLVRGASAHGLFTSEYALQYDTRNDEIDPRDGMFHQLGQRYVPGGLSGADLRYGQTNLLLRFFTTPFDPYLTLALRGMVDFLYGDPPFYELGRAERAFVFGGANAVRGIPGQRYYGMIKTFGTIELRTRLIPFSAFNKHMVLGLAGFVDGGRLWADYRVRPDLDGSGPGMKYGYGGGPRLLVGQVLLVRAEVAWSGDAEKFSGYLLAGHAF